MNEQISKFNKVRNQDIEVICDIPTAIYYWPSGDQYDGFRHTMSVSEVIENIEACSFGRFIPSSTGLMFISPLNYLQIVESRVDTSKAMITIGNEFDLFQFVVPASGIQIKIDAIHLPSYNQ